MNRIRFIVAERSYLIRKGIVSVINRIEFASVIKELENLDNINSVISQHKPHYLVFNPALVPEKAVLKDFQINLDLSVKGIAISSVPPYRKGILEKTRMVLHINESREALFDKLESLVKETYAQNKSMIISNELSEREKTILRHVARGQTNKEIAENLNLSAHTVITHRKNITAKLGIKTISGLTVYAILNNLVTLEEIRE